MSVPKARQGTGSQGQLSSACNLRRDPSPPDDDGRRQPTVSARSHTKTAQSVSGADLVEHWNNHPCTGDADPTAAQAAPIPALLTIADVSAIFRKSERTISRWLADGELPSLQLGHSVFVRSEDVSALISAKIEASAMAAKRRVSGAVEASGVEQTMPSVEALSQ